MKPLCRDEQLDTAPVVVRQCECRLQAEECLILHPDFVGSFDDDVPGESLITAHDPLSSNHIAVRVDGRERSGDGIFGVDERTQNVVLDANRSQCSTCGFGMVGSHCSDGFTGVSNDVLGEHRLIARDETVREFAGHVVGGNDRAHAVDGEGTRNVDGKNPCVWVWTAQGCAPQHVVGPGVGGKSETSLNFRHSIGAQCRSSKDTARRSRSVGAYGGGRRREGVHACSWRASRAWRTASKMRPYPVHRQMLPLMASRISISSGFGFRSRR